MSEEIEKLELMLTTPLPPLMQEIMDKNVADIEASFWIPRPSWAMDFEMESTDRPASIYWLEANK